MNHWSDNHFRQFASSLEILLSGYDTPEDEGFTERQKQQVEELVALEAEFRQALIRDPQGPDAYKDFVSYIMDKRRNILAARPYFRERQDTFKQEISSLLRDRHDKALYKFNINYPFVSFILRTRNFAKDSQVVQAAEKIKEARRQLIERNMPLAISRARIFYKATPRSHLEYMDIIQAASEGLIAAVDKFVLPYTPVFRAVIIGRISGNLIEDYSETLLHFYPSDKRKIYKAHKIRGRSDDMSSEEIAEKVNADADKIHKTNSSEITHLLSAASHVSLDIPLNDNSALSDGEPLENSADRFAADEATRPDVMYEQAEAMGVVKDIISTFPLFYQKLLKMKGIEL